jgi:hypothetical protein
VQEPYGGLHERLRQRLDDVASYAQAVDRRNRPQKALESRVDATAGAKTPLSQPREARAEIGALVLELGQHLMSNPIASDREVEVGGVLYCNEACVSQSVVESGPRELQEGPKKGSSRRLNGREAVDPGAVEEPQEYGFRLVVAMVAGDDEPRSAAPALVFQKRVTHPSCCRLGSPGSRDCSVLRSAGHPDSPR